jgi:hypothetical protein
VPGGTDVCAVLADEMFGKTNGFARLFANATDAAVTVATIE